MKNIENIKPLIEEQIFNNRKLFDFETREYNIKNLLKMYKNKELVIPKYNAEKQWTSERQSLFIETIILNNPVQTIMLYYDSGTNRLEVIDGAEKIKAIVSFYKNEMELTGLELLDLLNECNFSDLTDFSQRRFLAKTIRVVINIKNTPLIF